MDKKLARIRRSLKLRHNLKRLGSTRLVVHRTLKNIYAQIINSDAEILVSASTVEKKIKEQLKVTGNQCAAVVIGKIIAKRALEKGISDVSFDRSGFKYHGRVKALAESARKFGMKF